MSDETQSESMLSPYRVLDLTDEKGLLCGKLLADLGADVIKIEKPGGDATRNIGPFYHDETDPEKSLFWFAYNQGKRGITLDIETARGQELFRKLVNGADFVVESFPPGYMEKLSLGYKELEKLNPGIIMVSITPFGQTGPYKDYKVTDIVVWAMAGRVYAVGDADRPPVHISHHSQAYLQAGLEAAMAASMALYHRQMTGEGQYIDLSIQAAAAQTGNATWDLRKIVPQRIKQSGNIKVPRMYPCKDGIVSWYYMPATFEPWRNASFVRWMDSERMASEFLKSFDWTKLDYTTITQEDMDRIAEPTARFFASHTKLELLEGAVRHRILFYPHFTTDNILESEQLAAREFWAKVSHTELGTEITYPGAFAKVSETPIRVPHRAPLIGEHNREVYEKELGMAAEEIERLKQAGVI
jgi:crotonobetainyl-CoA:carnitine CoA-transferase CaiB-like acyl-CoA transferase